MKFSKTVSRQPRKKRKATAEAPLHARRKLVRMHLGKELREKFGKRNLPAKKGDRVKILRGKFAGISGKVINVDLSTGLIRVEGAVVKKQGGKEVFISIRPSIAVIIETERKAEKAAAPAEKKI
jgi:large subunit ribosomal protein L24